MKRQFEIVDIIVAIGMISTMIGALAFYQATYGGTAGIMTPTKAKPNPPMHVLVQTLLQPAMGQAIVDHAILEQQFVTDVSQGATKLYRATQAAGRPPMRGLGSIESRANQAQSEHKANVQYMMGRAIMTQTRQGLRAGALTADGLWNQVNQRIIENAQKIGDRMDQAFVRNWQPRLGQWIVRAAKQEHRYMGRIQERIGQATVELASIQHAYIINRADLKKQFKALTAASVRTNAQTELLAQLFTAERNFQRAPANPRMLSLQREEAGTLPGIPLAYLAVASASLIIMFLVGLTLPRAIREEERNLDTIEKRMERYRKAG